MTYPNIFSLEATNHLIGRINGLSVSSAPIWGKMNVGQMLAHCNVAYELVYDNMHPKPTGIKKFLIKLFAKKVVVGPKPYKKNSRTAPVFIITEEKDFQEQKKRLIDYLQRTQQMGEAHFHMKESHSFGHLTKDEWNNLFYKHLDHHLRQFGV